MNGIKYLLDTNIIISFMNGNKSLQLYFEDSTKVSISIISFLELLVYPLITIEEQSQIESFVDKITVFDLNKNDKEIIENIIDCRKKYKSLKLPDAIIFATAKYYDIELVSYDVIFNRLINDYSNINVLKR